MADELPVEALRSVEVDIAAFDDPDSSKADLVDGSVGEASMVHERFGFYAQVGFRDDGQAPRHLAGSAGSLRITRHRRLRFVGNRADMWISNAVAGRPKDYEFCVALLRVELVHRGVREERLAATSGLADPVRAQAHSWIHTSPTWMTIGQFCSAAVRINPSTQAVFS